MIMEEIDFIENNISLLKSSIDFDDIISNYLSETYTDDEIREINILEFRKDNVDKLQYRFSQIYNLDILSPENGFTILNIADSDDLKIKRYLHRFLIYRNFIGGVRANVDGSSQLFEEISANAVKAFLGEGSDVIMVGQGRSNLTSERLEEIAEELHEKKGSTHNLPKGAKDDGVDFIVYKNIDKRHVGNVILLGQASVGKNYANKKPINERWKNDYISYAVKPPIPVLSITHFLDESNLRKLHSDFGNALIFDRGRILKYFDVRDNHLNKKIVDYVNENIND